MTTQPTGPFVPGVTAAVAGITSGDDNPLLDPDLASTDADRGSRTDQGVPVGESDLEADRRRSGADDS
jgi:hypothetical protein